VGEEVSSPFEISQGNVHAASTTGPQYQSMGRFNDVCQGDGTKA
jgi:hypothetical protein